MDKTKIKLDYSEVSQILTFLNIAGLRLTQQLLLPNDPLYVMHSKQLEMLNSLIINLRQKTTIGINYHE